ncbi:MAG TPA: hypothetical protein VN366_13915 [Feifaniaceae bacterium]|nr:hypothetical protein [Feifaniaceae bacterium]
MNESIRAGTLPPRRMFGWLEAVFDIGYLCLALFIGVLILQNASGRVQTLAGIMALILAGGDMFHLLPRIAAAVTGDGRRFQKAMGLGKLVTSLTMTVFYVLLFHIGAMLFPFASARAWTAVIYALAASRIALCFFSQNRWYDEKPPVSWAVFRNIPFVLLGVAVAVLWGVQAQAVPGLRRMWLAIALSFAFYMPVVLFVNANRKLGMLMIPKSCAYLWILYLCASI